MIENHQTSRAHAIQFMDTLGVGASSLCAVHCMLAPAILAFLPAVNGRFVHSDGTHHFLAFWVVFFCMAAIVPGYLKHKRSAVLTLMVVGLSLVLYATFVAGRALGESWEIPIITCGNLSVIGAHLLNRKLSCNSEHAHKH